MALRIFNKLILIFFFFFVMRSFVINVDAFTPKARYSQSSVVAEGKLYFFGGIEGFPQLLSNETFYIDLTKEFDTSSVSWIYQPAIPVQNEGATTAVSVDDDAIFLVGGTMFHLETNTLEAYESVFSYNFKAQIWSKVEISGEMPLGRKQTKGVIDSKGKIYISQGISISSTPNLIVYDKGIVLDTINLLWSSSSSIGGIEWRGQSSATILDNGSIIYIGGQKLSGLDVDINQIVIYDTNIDVWSQVSATGATIDNRYGHTAVLDQGNIIIYGGAKGVTQTTPKPSLTILKVNNSQFAWEIPQTLTTSNPPPPLSGHSAEIVGDFMIIAFGNVTNDLTSPTSMNDKVFLLSLTTFGWVSHFTAPAPTPTSTPTQSAKDSTPESPTSVISNSKHLTPSFIMGMAANVLFLLYIYYF